MAASFLEQLFKKTVISIYGPDCMACEINTMHPQLDHIFPQSIWPARKYDPNNAQILCPDCNRLKDQSVVDYRTDNDPRVHTLRIEWCGVLVAHVGTLQERLDIHKQLAVKGKL